MSGLYSAGLAVILGGGYLTGKGPAGRLKPGTPVTPTAPAMPDQSQVLQAQQLQAQRTAALQQGRASTILTTNADTGDKLGP
jgi:hypothetical protein